MIHSRDAILDDVLGTLRQLADDWEYDGEITETTSFFTDMGLQSLDVVVLGTVVQERYRQSFPFPDLFTEIGQRETHDITVGEWVDFIHAHLERTPAMELGVPTP